MILLPPGRPPQDVPPDPAPEPNTLATAASPACPRNRRMVSGMDADKRDAA
jgi:hypothetical protein